MTAWGVAPARGRFRLCGICGARLLFVEIVRSAESAEAEQRLLNGIRHHLTASARCREASTFSGGVILACRCERPIPLPRDEGLICARCEALISPEVAAQPADRRTRSRRTGRTP